MFGARCFGLRRAASLDDSIKAVTLARSIFTASVFWTLDPAQTPYNIFWQAHPHASTRTDGRPRGARRQRAGSDLLRRGAALVDRRRFRPLINPGIILNGPTDRLLQSHKPSRVKDERAAQRRRHGQRRAGLVARPRQRQQQPTAAAAAALGVRGLLCERLVAGQ